MYILNNRHERERVSDLGDVKKKILTLWDPLSFSQKGS